MVAEGGSYELSYSEPDWVYSDQAMTFGTGEKKTFGICIENNLYVAVFKTLSSVLAPLLPDPNFGIPANKQTDEFGRSIFEEIRVS